MGALCRSSIESAGIDLIGYSFESYPARYQHRPGVGVDGLHGQWGQP